MKSPVRQGQGWGSLSAQRVGVGAVRGARPATEGPQMGRNRILTRRLIVFLSSF